MSIVAVHGPQTFGSRGVVESGYMMSNPSPTNGLMWDFKLDGPTTRSGQDFNWTFPADGTPSPQTVADPTVVTYATPGSKTATVVVTNTAKATINNRSLTSNVATLQFSAAHGFAPGQRITVSGAIGAPFVGGPYTLITASGTSCTFALVGADVTAGATTGTATSASDQYPPAGTYNMSVTAVTGTGPPGMSLRSLPPEGDTGNGGFVSGNGETYEPADHTVAEVQDYVTAHPDEVQAVYDSETAGRNRTTLVTWLETMLPFDPGDYSVADVEQYVTDNPEELEAVYAAEQAGKNRSTLIAWLESFQA